RSPTPVSRLHHRSGSSTGRPAACFVCKILPRPCRTRGLLSDRLPGRPAADLQRGGLNFSRGAHGSAHGDSVRVGPDGTYSVTLLPGSYSVIGALSGHPRVRNPLLRSASAN